MNETKERILYIALKHFLRKPYTEVTMNEILKDSGLSKGGFYHHFPSKEALYHEVIDTYVLGTFANEFANFNPQTNNLPFHEFIPAYINSTLNQILKLAGTKMESINLYIIMFDMMKYYDGFTEMLGNFHQEEINMLAALVDIAKERKEIREDIDSRSLANHVHTLMHGISVLAIFDNTQGTVDTRIKEMFDDLFRLIKV